MAIPAATDSAPREQVHPAPGPALAPLYALFVASGLTALVYEVMWMRSFSLVFGSSTRAASVVLASFFSGMAIGNLLGGRLARRSRSGALLGYALAELAIAAGALLVLAWLAVYRAGYPALYQSRLGTGPGLTALQLLLAFAAMAPPCAAMGATLPLISHALVSHAGHLGRRVGGVYALNTLGAAAGVLLSGFLLPVWIGTRASVYLAAWVNAAVGAAALLLWWLWRRAGPERPVPGGAPAPPRQAAAAPIGRDAVLLAPLAAAVSGFGTLALEVLYTRLIANAVDVSVYSFALMLGTFMVALALGSALVALVVDRLRSPWLLVAWASALGAAAILVSPSIFTWVRERSPTGGLYPGWGHLAWLAGFGMLVMGPAVVPIGVILPTVWKTAARRAEDAGRRIGGLTGINTLAAVAGSLAGGFLILPALGVSGGIAAIGLLYGALALLVLLRVTTGARRWVACAALAAGLAALASVRPWRALPLDLAPQERLVEYREGDSATVAVTREPRGLVLRLNNFYVLGSSRPGGIVVHRSQGQLGLLLHPDPRDVAFIGVATGLSLSAIKDFPAVRTAVAMELVPGVIEAASAFARANRDVLRDPRVEILVADGRNHLFGTDRRFDVIIGDLFVPWHPGTGNLYTAEHFRIVADRLKAGGLVVQWLQADQLSIEELRIIVATFTDAFPDAQLWLNRIQEGRPLLALVGRAPGGGERSAGPPGPDGRLAADPPLSRITFVCDGPALRRWAASAPRNTDDHPIIEFSAAATRLDRPAGEQRRMLALLARLAREAGSAGADPAG